MEAQPRRELRVKSSGEDENFEATTLALDFLVSRVECVVPYQHCYHYDCYFNVRFRIVGSCTQLLAGSVFLHAHICRRV